MVLFCELVVHFRLSGIAFQTHLERLFSLAIYLSSLYSYPFCNLGASQLYLLCRPVSSSP